MSDTSNENESRIFDWFSIGEFQNELHWEGLPDYAEVEANWEPRHNIPYKPHYPSLEAAVRDGFSNADGWENITDADRIRIWRISEKIISEGGGRWIDNNHTVAEDPEPDWHSPEDEGYVAGERSHHHTGIRVTLTKEEWAFIDALPLSTAQDWEGGKVGAPDELPWNDPEAYWLHITQAAAAAQARSEAREAQGGN